MLTKIIIHCADHGGDHAEHELADDVASAIMNSITLYWSM